MFDIILLVMWDQIDPNHLTGKVYQGAHIDLTPAMNFYRSVLIQEMKIHFIPIPSPTTCSILAAFTHGFKSVLL